MAESGTIEEIEQFRRAGKYVALYFSNAPVSRDVDRDQLEALERYKEARRADTKYEVFSNAEDLRRQVLQHLTGIVVSVAKPLQLGMWRNEPSVSAPLGSIDAGSSSLAKEPESDIGRAMAPNPTLLDDVISELEDNLDCASRPTTGDVYRRPSTKAWLEYRNKINLPPEVLSQIKNAYNRIGSWGDVVASGLNPNSGSMELNIIISDLRSSLPALIDRLRKLH